MQKVKFVTSFERGICFERASLMAQTVKNLPPMQETWVQCLSWEDPLEEEILTPVSFPGEFHGQRSLAGYSSWDSKESDTTERLTLSLSALGALSNDLE